MLSSCFTQLGTPLCHVGTSAGLPSFCRPVMAEKIGDVLLCSTSWHHFAMNEVPDACWERSQAQQPPAGGGGGPHKPSEPEFRLFTILAPTPPMTMRLWLSSPAQGTPKRWHPDGGCAARSICPAADGCPTATADGVWRSLARRAPAVPCSRWLTKSSTSKI